MYKDDGRLHELEWGTMQYWKQSGVRIACLGLENQSKPDQYMPIRTLAYDGASYRQQLLKENKDKPKYPVVTLVLYFGYREKWQAPRTLYETFSVPDLLKPYISDYRINLFELHGCRMSS